MRFLVRFTTRGGGGAVLALVPEGEPIWDAVAEAVDPIVEFLEEVGRLAETTWVLQEIPQTGRIPW